MAITTLAQLTAALGGAQLIHITRNAGINIGSAVWADTLSIAGDPAAGTLAGTSTAAGVVPTDATAGFPVINNFPGGNTGYLGAIKFEIANPALQVRARLYDMLFKAGAYAFNANVTLASQPSYSSRLPGADYKGTEIWLEKASSITGNLTVAITYTNQDGVAGQSTSVTISSVGGLSHMLQFPLVSGDTGVQKIESVIGSVATAGTFNIIVLRPLWCCSDLGMLGPTIHGPDLTDLPIVFGDSALGFMGISPLPTFDATLSVING